jgi:hypothetical protein
LSNAFENFVNGMDLPDPEPSEAIPAPGDDMMELPSELVNRISAHADHLLELIQEVSPRELHAGLSPVEDIVLRRILERTRPSAEAIQGMTPEELVANAVYTYVTVAFTLNRNILQQLLGPSESEDGSE